MNPPLYRLLTAVKYYVTLPIVAAEALDGGSKGDEGLSGGFPHPSLPYVKLPKGLVATKGYQVVSSSSVSRMDRRLEWSIGLCWRWKLKCSEVDVGGSRWLERLPRGWYCAVYEMRANRK
jgi:hypothetical protein